MSIDKTKQPIESSKKARIRDELRIFSCKIAWQEEFDQVFLECSCIILKIFIME